MAERPARKDLAALKRLVVDLTGTGKAKLREWVVKVSETQKRPGIQKQTCPEEGRLVFQPQVRASDYQYHSRRDPHLLPLPQAEFHSFGATGSDQSCPFLRLL